MIFDLSYKLRVFVNCVTQALEIKVQPSIFMQERFKQKIFNDCVYDSFNGGSEVLNLSNEKKEFCQG